MGLETDLAKLVEEQHAGPGIKCLLYKNVNNPTVAVHGSILAGTSSEPSGKSGLAELTTRLLIRGTRQLGAGKIADQLESVGAAVSFRNSQDSIIFQARMTSPWTKRVLGVVTDCLTRPALSPRDIEREREGLLTDIRLRDDDTTINSKKNTGLNSASKSVKREIVMPHKTQADILIGGVACSRTEPDYEPLNLLKVILGELGFMGRLGQRVRDKEGLAYSCTSFLNAGIAGGSWTALAGVNPRNVAKALELMKEEIERVRQELVEEQELMDAKQNQLGSELMELEATEGIARTSHNLAHFDLGLDYFVKRRQLFSKITREDLTSMGKKYLDSSRLSTVIVGPRLKR